MKKILMVLAIAGVLVSCSSKDETVKKDTATTKVVTPQKAVPEKESVEASVIVPAKVVVEEKAEEPAPKTTTKPKKSTKKSYSATKKKAAPRIVEEAPKVEEKAETTAVVPQPETDIDKAVDNDVDKKITEVEIDSKKVEPKPVEEKKSNTGLYATIAAIVVAAGAVVAFKKKSV